MSPVENPFTQDVLLEIAEDHKIPEEYVTRLEWALVEAFETYQGVVTSTADSELNPPIPPKKTRQTLRNQLHKALDIIVNSPGMPAGLAVEAMKSEKRESELEFYKNWIAGRSEVESAISRLRELAEWADRFESRRVSSGPRPNIAAREALIPLTKFWSEELDRGTSLQDRGEPTAALSFCYNALRRIDSDITMRLLEYIEETQ